jgi:hypothetical protein
MTANIPFNWQATTNAAGSFYIQSAGLVQGFYEDDPANMFNLTGGVVSTSETAPMFGGIAINDVTLPNTGSNPPLQTLGPYVSRATNVTANASGSITGFTVLNQAYAGTITPQGNVPLFGSSQSVNYLRLGSNMRLAVACASSMSSNEGATANQQVSWDFYNQMLIPYVAAWAAVAAGGISSATYTSSTGILALTFGTAPFGASVGSTMNGYYITIGGLTGTGNGSQLNGNWAITSTASSGTVINVQAPAGLGSITVTTTNGTLAQGGGALDVRLTEIYIGNCLTVAYNATTGFYNYNTNGNAALILL